ncbi:beta-ketoacyl-[acyl-carrier-protein] synthase family protein [Streptomyces capillispiralis]|uniref:3-oxoacyl-[acyl-carrier-protein] synthase II n=1 Tax=Streptomyces capillispiralis TaxID=68182 RepID=A0A561TCG7_9ACTN|nr:beta-ketoacyl-[acyl-carrier-protein] synthase family protein [Streptomyces capillispiralis]TWF84763.1 3-oxoacyl-[acyl-carrier-protein] synthase II [Streptomyces capillispiralis]GHH96132.1 3-oxoacyl-[acyl-carrier-protein] synthase 2 [Streptomyces capillispiralis]
MKRVVITGMGAVTPVGNDAPTTWASLAAGRSGVGPLTLFDAAGFPVRIAAQVKDFDPAAALPPDVHRGHLSRVGRFGVAAAYEAQRDAGIDTTGERWYAPEDRGVAMGASVGRPELRALLDVGHLRATTGRPDAFVTQPPRTALTDNQNLPMSAMARTLAATGPMIGVSTACAGSGHALGEAFRAIQEGDARLMLAGGHDSLTTWLDLLGFSLLGALTDRYNDDPERASRPFDADRSGFVIGEGAVAFVLEERESALARGARVLAEILGYGSTLNAWRITDSPPDGSGAIQAMEGALAESGLPTGAVDYVVAHGTSTHGNDRSETTAIKKVFGDDAGRLLVSSPKSMTGHLTAASLGLNVLAGIGAIRHSLVPPTLNLDTPDRGLDLDFVPHTARPAAVSAVLVNAFAFGGSNTSLVIGAHREDA